MPFNKSGPITQEELFDLWKSVVDQQGYARPLIDQPDSGIELVEQMQAQMAAVSLAVDQTFQSLYILPWSGQTGEPAGGARLATVLLEVTRSNQATVAAGTPILLQAGLRYLHAPFDFSDDGPVQVLTGRRYLGEGFIVLGPGELGPVMVTALSEAAAAGYNLPRPGTITVLDQPGAAFSNDGASVQPTATNNRLQLRDEPEVLTPDSVGQYIVFTAGSNLGRIARVIGYEPSVPGNGGVALLAAEAIVSVSGVVGQFIVGEAVTQVSTLSSATFLHSTGPHFLLAARAATLGAGAIVGTQSGATATVTLVEQPAALVAESFSAGWRVLDWLLDLGLQVTNPASPTGGRTAVLDAIGDERKVSRSPGEEDDVYRERVATPADTVSPNAIRRAINRVLAPLNLSGCLREVGTELMRGFFYDGDPTSTDPDVAFAYDFDLTLRPQDRYKFLLDYTEFRAFFLVGVPRLGTGEFGFAYDDHPLGFYDAAPYAAFYDGYPVGAADIYRRLYNNIAAVIAGGVGFDLIQDDNPCV